MRAFTITEIHKIPVNAFFKNVVYKNIQAEIRSKLKNIPMPRPGMFDEP